MRTVTIIIFIVLKTFFRFAQKLEYPFYKKICSKSITLLVRKHCRTVFVFVLSERSAVMQFVLRLMPVNREIE